MTLKIALVQFKPVQKDVQANIQNIQQMLSGVQADLVVLPELANTSYLYESQDILSPFSESNDGNGPFLSAMITMAKAINGVIICGYAEQAGNILYNSAAAVSHAGVIANYRKIHLFSGEKQLFQPGKEGFVTFDWRGVKIGMMICFDWFFPEAARSLALDGAQIIAHPANLVLPYCQNAMVTRSIENKVFTITANRIGKERLGEKQLAFTGLSQITNPLGEIIFRASKNQSTVYVTEIDPINALNKNVSEQNDLFDDRRPELYSLYL